MELHPSETAKAVQTITDGGLAVIIITTVFGFMLKMVTMLSKVISALTESIKIQTAAFGSMEKSFETGMAVHSETIRGLSTDVNELKTTVTNIQTGRARNDSAHRINR